MFNKFSLPFISFLQAFLTTLYCLLFALVIFNTQSFTFLDTPFLGILLFLLVFIFSALITGGLMLGYPLYLVLNKKIKTAVLNIVYSMLWLVLIILVILGCVFFMR